jgi:alpha-L-fucosidase 2
MIDRGADALANNAGIHKDDSAAIGGNSGCDCVSPVGHEICNLPWALHNYWLQYRYSMDNEKLRRLFPTLKRSINYYHHFLKEGPDGKLHISNGWSPEYPGQSRVNPDTNIDLALLRWGCQTLLDSAAKLKIDDPLIPRWKDTLARLAPYPQDENGLKVSASTPFARSHRHYSHLLMIYPLYIMTPEQPENRELVIRSLKHWMGMPKELLGYSYTGAASISALLCEGDEAARYLNKLLNTLIPPNTLYVESGPVIETPLSAAASLNDMLLSSWGDRIRVFPGVPTSWKDVSFHNLRTQGASLVSATRK